jgi:hypothetical protein
MTIHDGGDNSFTHGDESAVEGLRAPSSRACSCKVEVTAPP